MDIMILPSSMFRLGWKFTNSDEVEGLVYGETVHL